MAAYSNFWGQTMLPFGRSSDELIVELNRRQASPPTPYELLPAVSDTVFGDRMRLLRRHLERYSWSIAEKIYLVFAFVVSVISPWPIMFLLTRTLAGSVFNNQQIDPITGQTILSSDDVRKLAEARFASFGVLVGIWALVWIPYLLFKRIGSRRRAALLQTFTHQDSEQGRSPEVHLIWNARAVSTFAGTAQVAIKLPVGLKQGGNPNVSSFAPGAPLPMYVAYPQPMDMGYADEKQGLAPMAPPPQMPPAGRQASRPATAVGATLNRNNSNGSQTGRQLYAPPAGPPPGTRNDDKV